MSEETKEETKVRPSKPRCTCGLCWQCIDLSERPNTIQGYSIGKTRRDKMLSQIQEDTLKTAVWDAWKMTRIYSVCPEESLGYYLKYHEAQMSFITDICKTREVTRISKANNDPESVRKFKEALLARREAAQAGKGKKKKAPKHDTNGEKIETGVRVAAMYKCEDPEEKAVMKAILNLHKTGMLKIAYDSTVKMFPKFKIDEIIKKMGITI